MEQPELLGCRAYLYAPQSWPWSLTVREHTAIRYISAVPEQSRVGALSAGGTANKRYTIDVSDYVRNALNGLTDSRTRVAFAVVRLFRYNVAGGGTFGYPADPLGSNQVVRMKRLVLREGFRGLMSEFAGDVEPSGVWVGGNCQGQR